MRVKPLYVAEHPVVVHIIKNFRVETRNLNNSSPKQTFRDKDRQRFQRD